MGPQVTDRDAVRKLVSQWRRSLFWLCVAASLWGIILVLTGGVETQIGAVRVSSRNPERPFWLALAAFVGYCLVGRVKSMRGDGHPLERTLARSAPELVAVATAATFFVGIAYGTSAAGGADASGYVSQARLWLQGQLRVPVPLSSLVWWAEPEWVFSPLGYRPATVPGMVVPTYPPGRLVRYIRTEFWF